MNPTHSAPLLDVQDLSVSFPSQRGRTNVVKNVSFSLGQERLGIVGESGSGKSMTGRALLGLIRAPGKVHAKRMNYKGKNLLDLTTAQMRRLRGAELSMIMQDPRYSLNPIMTVKQQIAEALVTHEKITKKQIHNRVIEMLEAVRINDPEEVARLYPHQLSGGMGQRVMIAMMLIPRPQVLIADEPTSALDVSVQAQVLELLNELVQRRGMGLILISHDLNLISSFCDRILIMYAGGIVEKCSSRNLSAAQHPYTKGLLASIPDMHETREVLPTLDRSQWSTP